jgi:quercetin dioxygenase-like cupin family protein
MKLLLVAPLLLLGLAPALAQTHQHTMTNVGQEVWKDGPPFLPKGAQSTVLYGDPSKEGMFVLRLKLPANYKIPPHTHSVDEIVTVISGQAKVGMGKTADEKGTTAVKAGGVITMGPGMEHYVLIEEPTVVQLSTRGPFNIRYVNEVDDPRKTQ